MSGSFKNFKKKSMRAAFVKSAVAGVFSALLAVGVVLLILKPNAVQLHWGFHLLIGAVVAAVGFGVTFLLTRPTDKKLAKRLDSDYTLHEKVQTMVEFEGQKGEMLRLQRENTSEILKNVPRKRPSVKRLWQYILLPVLACAVFVTSVLIPATQKDIPPVDGFEITNWQETALEQLITEVKGSALEDGVKEPATQALEDLLSVLKSTNQGATMRAKVISTVGAVDDAVIAANSYRDIVLALAVTQSLNDFSTSILNAVSSYQDNNVIASMSVVTERAALSEDRINAALSEFTVEFLAEFDGIIQKKEIADKVLEFLDPFNANMINVTDMSEDKLYIALSDFSSALGEAEQYYWYELDALKEVISTACTDYVFAASVALEPQVYNCMMDEFIRNRLSEIFGISTSQFPSIELVLPNGESSGSNGNDDPINSGGFGDGTVKYGSDDLVYDPDNSEHVQYGTILNDYYGMLLEYFQTEEMTEEMKNYISQYFALLYGNQEEEDGNS